MKSISERIVEGMAIRNMKQVDIVERTGINKGALSSYISGKYKPKQTNIFLIAKALHVNEAWLMGHDVPMEREQIITHITPQTLNNDPELDKLLLNVAQMIFTELKDDEDFSEKNTFILDILNSEKINSKVKSIIYNELFDHISYNKSDNVIELNPKINYKNEPSLLQKYHSLDEKGKHTVDTVLEMEYARCNKSKITEDTTEEKKHDDSNMND